VTLLNRELVGPNWSKIMSVSVFPDIVEDCPKIPKILLHQRSSDQITS